MLKQAITNAFLYAKVENLETTQQENVKIHVLNNLQ